ncbi:[protein release factor]-glutamine N5-methyltransferase [Palleronia marisminoris]|uniref:Release factor glutamine methyltransferase n=1 Tax=Palleronia marisminoris TaxID=315423 RepID=A0A1Y5TAM0_9RHOB|nr:peptide chain release factor N(5)-glutamine methyltransferase [Palleronia marisminoris]SFH22171.1 [protein release factor]-glutamine N5-methyltransferase [Palleronia marisminoris]SLN57717.1 Release factor glutamine methyltransferase [Palleronia marisminoris]
MSPDDALRMARTRLGHCPDPMRDARRLLADAAGLDPGALHRLDDTLPAETRATFEALVARRAGGEPLARVLGYRDFWRHRFQITPDVLDPRADTETLVARALEVPWQRVLDLGTGSGCILLSLLAERGDAQGVGTDISDAALDVARGNAAVLGLADRVRFARADWWQGVSGRFDLIVSNPPYIATDEMDELSPEVRDHDPRLALSPGGDGLEAYRIIAGGAADMLEPGGTLMVEIGWQQGPAVTRLFSAAGLADVALHTDLEGRDRVVSARRPP